MATPTPKRLKRASSIEYGLYLPENYCMKFRKWHVRQRLYAYQRGHTCVHARTFTYYAYDVSAHYAWERTFRRGHVPGLW
jgi:hypothetical protein